MFCNIDHFLNLKPSCTKLVFLIPTTFCWSILPCVTISTLDVFSRTLRRLRSSCCATCHVFCDVIAQSDWTTRVRQSCSVLPTQSRCLQGPPDSLLPTRATVLRIKNSSPLFASGEQTFGTSPFHWRLGWNPKRPPGWASSSPPKGQRTVVPFCGHRDTSVWGRWEEVGELQSIFCIVVSGQLYFIQQASRPPRTTLSQPPLRSA